ncbi:MAG: glycosyltransferase family 1 protein [Chloroflexi bacterium]|nr:MAG: glycosyltransferase family 1 protein [Chloroflexota bacterium]
MNKSGVMNKHEAKIAYIRMLPGRPYANQIMASVLQASFPEMQVDVVDVIDLLRSHKSVLAGNLWPLIREYGVDILTGRKSWSRFFLVTSYMFRQIRRLLRQYLATEQYLFTFQMQSLFDASLPGVPHFVYTDHTVLANLWYPQIDLRRVLYSPAWIRLEREIYKHAQLIFVRSANVRRSVIEQYDVLPDKVICVYAGSNVPITAVSSSPPYHKKHILFVGMDWVRKGGPDLVAAFRQVLVHHPDARLTIVGCRPAVDVPNCRVVGRVPLHAMRQFYQDASIFCMPTRLEPFGVVFAEALTYGLPIVATRVGAVPDMVRDGENGYLVEPGDVSALAAALDRLLADGERRRLFGERAREYAQRYSWERVGQEIRRCIEPVLAGVWR